MWVSRLAKKCSAIFAGGSRGNFLDYTLWLQIAEHDWFGAAQDKFDSGERFEGKKCSSFDTVAVYS